MEDKIGYIETVKQAGLVILEQNLLGVSPEEIADMKARKTITNGKPSGDATVAAEQTAHSAKGLTKRIPNGVFKPFDLQER